MKIVKKSLLLASTLALALAVTGCQKNNLLKGVKPQRLGVAPTQISKSTLKGSFEEVRYYNTLGSRYIKYTTAQGKTAVYDYKAEKEVFSTEENVNTIYLYSEVILLINYSDGTQEMRFIDGTSIYEKAKYDNIYAGNLETKYSFKLDNYEEIIAYTYNDEPGKDIEFTYYSIVYKGKKNENKKIVQDYSSFTITKISADDVKKYHAGDTAIEDGSYYSSNVMGDTIVYFNTLSNKPIVGIDFDGGYKTVISKDKAILQIQTQTNYDGNYTVTDGNSYYNVDTYLINLKNGTYKRLNNFNYFLKNTTYTSFTDNYYCFRNAGKIEGKEIICYNDITVSIKDGKINDNQKYVCSTSFIDLQNGNYLSYYNGMVFITNKNGEIKKEFEGYSTVFPKGKVIVISNGNKYRFIDFKGNYITDKAITATSKYDISLDTMYYKAVDGVSHVITFADGKIATDDEVLYTVRSGYVDIDDIRSNVFYVEKSNFYFEAKDVVVDSYGDTTSCTLEFRQLDSHALIQTIEGITSWSYSASISDDNMDARYYFTAGPVSEMTNSYTLSIYELE